MMHYEWAAKLTRNELKEVLRITNTPFEFRVSDLLLDQLHYGLVTGDVHPEKVLDEILTIENGKKSRTGDVEPFKSESLKGLWKKHYFQANFIPRNLVDEFKLTSPRSGKFAELCNVLKKSIKDDRTFAAELAHKYVVEGFEKRSAKGKLRGEWIILTKHHGQNYYLSLAFHSESDEAIRERVLGKCTNQFPFLPSIFAIRSKSGLDAITSEV